MNNRIIELEQLISEQDLKIETLQHNLDLGRGFAVQYMFDMNLLYDELNCPVYTANEEEQLILDKLLVTLADDPLFLNRKMVTLVLSRTSDNSYLINGLAFTPLEANDIRDMIDNGSSVPYPAIKAYSISLTVNDGNIEFEILQ